MRHFVCFMLAALLMTAGLPVWAAYPTPQAAGFHHCALIYDTDPRGPSEFSPYVAYDKEPKWLFDAFLFLIQNSGRGVRTEYGETQKVDWQYQFDRWFAPGRDLAALDDAIDAASKRLGPPPAKRRVMLSIPYINRAVKEFGEINGKPVDLSSAAGRDAAVNWYVSEAVRQFEAARYRHLELWGFYWMREDIPEEDVPLVKAAADIVHAKGYRLLWIPCNGETGYQRWKRAGIDVAIYQPNYAFGTWQHAGRIGRNRIARTADIAKRYGLGVEMEAFDINSKAADQRAFAQYLADGAPRRYGYQAGATAYYTAETMVEQTARSTDPNARKAYDNLAHYILNRPVPDPDAPLRWKWTSSKGVRVAEAVFGQARSVACVNAYLDEPGKQTWRGIMEVSVLRPGAKGWSTGGWAIRAGKTLSDGRRQWAMVPVGGRARAVRIAFRPLPGSGPLRLSGIDVDPNDVAGRVRHAAVGRPYRFSPPPQAKYGDTGRLLVDGVIPANGYLDHKTVGWLPFGKDVSICFDLGRPMLVQRLAAWVQGGGIGGVDWPDRAVALLTEKSSPPTALEGRGELPGRFTVVHGGDVVIDRRRSDVDMDGYVPFQPAKAVRARYVTVLLQAPVWLMVSEVTISVNGRNVAPQAAYALRPTPPAGDSEDNRYEDDGVRLTDGAVAQGFNAPELTGWMDDTPHVVTVDLGAARPVREVTVWSLAGGESGIYAPREIAVETSVDGGVWMALGVDRPAVSENGSKARALPCRVAGQSARTARYVRVKATRARDWCMLSEVEVR